MLKVGFLGFGNMAQALAQGWRQALPHPEQLALYACARDFAKLQRNAAPLQVQPCAAPLEVVQAADIIILAVKPAQVEQVMRGLRPLVVGGSRTPELTSASAAPTQSTWSAGAQGELMTELDYEFGAGRGGDSANASASSAPAHDASATPASQEAAPTFTSPLKGKLIVSVVAGLTPAQLCDLSWQEPSAIFTIPNTAVAVRQGMTVVSTDHTLSEEQLAQFTQLWSMVSKIEMVAPEQLAIAGTISGCTPAYTAMFMEALADAAVRYGLPRYQAYRCIAQMLVGVGTLQQELQLAPNIIKDAVCSPAGSTIRGVAQLEDEGFRGVVMRAIDAVQRK